MSPFQTVRLPSVRTSPAAGFFLLILGCADGIFPILLSLPFAFSLFSFCIFKRLSLCVLRQFPLYFQDPDVFLCLLFNAAAGRSIVDPAFLFLLYFPTSSLFFPGFSAGMSIFRRFYRRILIGIFFTLFTFLVLRLPVPCMLSPFPVIRHDIGAVDDPTVFHEPESIHYKCGQAFPADPDEGNHGNRKGSHAQDDNACG